jgi:hypothetical protein
LPIGSAPPAVTKRRRYQAGPTLSHGSTTTAPDGQCEEDREVDAATRIAVQSALTGHFVLSSLHATDAVSALHRLLDMGIEHFPVASSVTAVLSHRLLRRSCPTVASPT